MAGGSWTLLVLRFSLNDLKTKQLSVSISIYYISQVSRDILSLSF